MNEERGKRLRAAREAAELTLRAVTEELKKQGIEMTFGHLSRIELDDKIKIKPSVMKALATLYHKTPEYLYSGNRTGGESFSAMPTRYLVVDKEERAKILLVPHKAEAGYRQHLTDDDYLGTLETIALPGFSAGDYRAFEVSGNSMEPTFSPGDLVICEHIERPEDIEDGWPYVLVTTEGICLKRVTNLVVKKGYLIIESDNPAYKPDIIQPAEVLEMWKYRAKFSFATK